MMKIVRKIIGIIWRQARVVLEEESRQLDLFYSGA